VVSYKGSLDEVYCLEMREGPYHVNSCRHYGRRFCQSLAGLRAIEALIHQVPFIAMIDVASLYGTTPMFQWHFVVPLALQNERVLFHEPADGPDRQVPRDAFLAAWATAGYRGVRVWIP
jgi:hypothetical protein